ncbi:hypothetical protein [Bradyrhizobium elkanii]|uniref:Uncharacterized protein n=1 Tax=Bradyrhizobium elkanii TaxID=29448 RepID=A0ABV4EZZ4_BRAEL|nr:hypothetical protein [Bradyrhizobium elkanii]MCP1757772.1 hypothetical protein [Bradyrhizobium elkanii]MCS3881931.1 hypothetical protein [Bradyrhizobium elkanii]MCS4218691.1 hypothetical protein [Bradyrhizobium elkanii]MCW2110004.1 hypothetical protein [Bradyrhizobium elkanii]MCW2201626.1 hypothetical protein [Bradyrhizobium elkanii]
MPDRRVLSAAGLQIREAELKAALEIRELFAQGVLQHDRELSVDRPDGFNMNIVSDETECGTTCCIGGWMFRAMERDRTAPCATAAEYVQRASSRALYPLFFPLQDQRRQWMVDTDGHTYDGPEYIDIAPSQALEAMDNFLATGDPNWPRVLHLENIEVARA